MDQKRIRHEEDQVAHIGSSCTDKTCVLGINHDGPCQPKDNVLPFDRAVAGPLIDLGAPVVVVPPSWDAPLPATLMDQVVAVATAEKPELPRFVQELVDEGIPLPVVTDAARQALAALERRREHLRRPESHRALVGIGEATLAQLAGVPETLQVVGLHADSPRQAVMLVVQGPELPVAAEFAELPVLHGTWERRDVAIPRETLVELFGEQATVELGGTVFSRFQWVEDD